MQPPKRSNPWMWIGITCLVIVVLAIIGMVICFVFAARNPDIKKIFSGAMEESPRMQICLTQLEKTGQALNRYAGEHNGEFPKTLDELVPKYVAGKSEFVCPSSKDQAEYRYTQPQPSDPGSTVVVECANHEIGPVIMKLELQKDGSVRQVR